MLCRHAVSVCVSVCRVVVLVLVLKESLRKVLVLVLVLGAQVIVLVLVLDTQVLVLALEEKSLVVSLFLVFFVAFTKSFSVKAASKHTLHVRFYYLTSTVIVFSQVFCINLNAWNVHTDVTTFAQVLDLVLVLVLKSWSLSWSLRVKSLSWSWSLAPKSWFWSWSLVKSSC